jgi:dihydroorotase
MIESVLIKQVQIITPFGKKEGDVLIKNGKIHAMDWKLPEHAEVIISDRGLTLIPGVIDPHVHFREPGATWKETLETGSRAAVSGGVTTFFEMPNTKPSAICRNTIAEKKKIASQTSMANYNFYIGATTDNLEELKAIENVPGIKIFVGSSTGSLLVDQEEDLRRIFTETTALIAVHSEMESIIRANKDIYKDSTNPLDHPRIRSVDAAVKCTKMLLKLSHEMQRRLHILHLTTEEEMQLIAKAKKDTPVTTEVSPQHLLLHGPEVYLKLGNFAVINPPIREKRHADALWQGLKSGVIDCIATDHAPHTIEEKQLEYGKAPSGMPGIETSLSLMLNLVAQKKCTIDDVVKWMCETPAKLFGIPYKGALQIGYDADLVLLDLNAKRTIENTKQHTKCKWSAFDGWQVQGIPIATMVGGKFAYREGEFFTSTKGSEVKIRKPKPKV